MQDAHRPTSVKEAAAAIISRCQTQIALLQNDIALAKRRLDDPKYEHMSEADRVANESEIFHRKQLPTPINSE